MTWGKLLRFAARPERNIQILHSDGSPAGRGDRKELKQPQKKAAAEKAATQKPAAEAAKITAAEIATAEEEEFWTGSFSDVKPAPTADPAEVGADIRDSFDLGPSDDRLVSLITAARQHSAPA